MRGKVKYVDREELTVTHTKKWHERLTDTYVGLYNEDMVSLDEDDIRDYYGQSRITRHLVNTLNDDLHNVWIEYEEGDDGFYYLSGYLEDYI